MLYLVRIRVSDTILLTTCPMNYVMLLTKVYFLHQANYLKDLIVDLTNEETAISSDEVSGSSHRSLVVAFDGNVGAGKSTFLNYCSSKSDTIIFPEPVDKWRNLGGVNVLVSC